MWGSTSLYHCPINCLSSTSISDIPFLSFIVLSSFPLSSPQLPYMATAEIEKETKVILTKPISLEAERHYEAPNLLQRILSLFTHIRPGSDLTHFQVPAVFNVPKSQLQYYGESIYSVNGDLIRRCNSGESPLERLINVVAWAISTTRPFVFGVVALNPILGETHHVSRSSLNVLLEQVSHHPPVSALHATDEKENVEIIWCHQPLPKFYGTSVEAQVLGKRKLKLKKHGETYEMNSPNLLFRFLPTSGVGWVGNVTIRCQETGLVAELCYKSRSFVGFKGNHRSIKGKILDSFSSKVLYDVDGHWDRIVTIKDKHNGRARVIYDAKEAISDLQTPIVKSLKGVWPTESAVVWSEVNEAIMKKEWDEANEVKKCIEERQRYLFKERELRGQTWTPKYFSLSLTKGGWECSPLHQWVPSAPIIAP